MARSPRFKVYSAAGEYVASCKYAEDAANVAANYEGGTIRDGHSRVVWSDADGGAERAANSADFVAETIYSRTLNIQQ